MTVRPTSPNPYASPVTEVSPTQTEGPTTQPSNRGASRTTTAGGPVGDRVELSPQARHDAAAAAHARSESPELEEARVALRAQPKLSPERVQELRQRVASGHYDTPDASEQIARAITRGLHETP